MSRLASFAGTSVEVAARLNAVYRARFFRRRPTPTPQLVETMRRARDEAPGHLRLLFLWGIHEKPLTDSFDADTMMHLNALTDRIASTLNVRVNLAILICDSHGLINGIDPCRSAGYQSEIGVMAQKRGWTTTLLSAIWADAGLTRASVEALAAQIDPEAIPAKLFGFAGRLYRGANTEAGARLYYAARMLERRPIADWFAGHINLTPSEPAFDELQPDLPIFHIWTAKKGCSAKPWFTISAPACAA